MIFFEKFFNNPDLQVGVKENLPLLGFSPNKVSKKLRKLKPHKDIFLNWQ